jgi:hypothetical protein
MNMAQELSALVENDLEIRVNGKYSITIRGYSGSAAAITIPGEIYNIPVTVIGKRAFKEKGFQRILLPDSMTALEEECFSKNQIKEVIIPATVSFLEAGVFYKNLIQRLVFSEGLKVIGDFCFYGCQLEEISLPASLEKIGVWAFGGNPIRDVRIGARLAFKFTDSISDLRPSFDEAYETNGKKAGRYVFSDGRWHYEG